MKSHVFAGNACVRVAIETDDATVCVLSVALFRPVAAADGSVEHLPNVSVERIPGMGPVVSRLVRRSYCPPLPASSGQSLCWW